MTLDELKADLKDILAIERQEIVDWAASEDRCLRLIRRLKDGPEQGYPHDIVYHFLDDPDVRQKDARYAAMQRQKVSEWLE